MIARTELELKICCILNEMSGRTAASERYNFVDLFANHGINVEILKTTKDRSIVEIARNSVRENYDVIVAGGGDGTISAVASALIGYPRTRLGILPLGTLNHFARDLNIPVDIPEAVDVICTGHFERIDVGSVNDKHFLNNSSVGLYPAVVKLRESLQSAGYGKWWAAAISTLRMLIRFRRLELEIRPSAGLPVKRRTALLFVGNNAYETSAAKLGTRLSIQGGRLWITLSTASNRFRLLLSLLALVMGRERPENALIFEAEELDVAIRNGLVTVALDGEVLSLRPPLKYSILPKALSVIVPLSKVVSP